MPKDSSKELSDFDERGLHLGSLEAQQVQLELLFREIVALEVLGNAGGVMSAAVGLVQEALAIIQGVVEQHEREDSTKHQLPLTGHTG